MKLTDNRKNWTRVRLDDVVVRREENDKANAQSRFDSFVKVDHMEAGSLHLKGVGSQKDEELPPTFYKIFRKGQILFPTRNPHLRRTALAHCDGICGEKTLTLEVNDKVADPRFIPFLFHSSSFYDHTAGAIIGSTNPHCRWRDVANYEFFLPPKVEQAKLAELLLTSDTQVETIVRLAERHRDLISALMQDLKASYFSCSKKCECRHFESGRIDDFLVLQRGFDLTQNTAIPGKVPVVSSSGVGYTHNVAMCQAPGVVTGRKGKLGDVFFLNDAHWPHDTSLWVKDFKGNNPRFVYWFLKAIDLNSFNAATAVPTLNRNVIHPIAVKFPCIECQKAIVEQLDSVDSLMIQSGDFMDSSKALLRSITNKIF